MLRVEQAGRMPNDSGVKTEISTCPWRAMRCPHRAVAVLPGRFTVEQGEDGGLLCHITAGIYRAGVELFGDPAFERAQEAPAK